MPPDMTTGKFALAPMTSMDKTEAIPVAQNTADAFIPDWLNTDGFSAKM